MREREERVFETHFSLKFLFHTDLSLDSKASAGSSLDPLVLAKYSHMQMSKNEEGVRVGEETGAREREAVLMKQASINKSEALVRCCCG